MRNPDAILAALFANRPAPTPRSADRVSLLCGLLDAYERELSGRLDRYLQLARRGRERALDGHDLDALSDAIEAAIAWDKGPAIVICNTVKGKGVDFMENKAAWHYGGLSGDLVAKAKASIGEE